MCHASGIKRKNNLDFWRMKYKTIYAQNIKDSIFPNNSSL